MNFTLDYQQQHPRQPTTGFVLIRTHQAGIVASNLCCDLNQAGLSAYALKRPLVGKVRKIDAAKSFTAQRLRHCRLIVRF